MGARTPGKLRLRSATHKCDICSKKFSSPAVLKTHQQTHHSSANRRMKKKIVVKKGDLKAKLKVQKSKIVVKPSVSRKVLNKPIKKEVSTMKVVASRRPKVSNQVVNKSLNEKNIQFACPKCPKAFNVYFSAFKHIQKHHCVNSKGEKVEPYSKDIIKPIRKDVHETLLNLTEEPPSPTDSAETPEENIRFAFACIACKQHYATMKMFDIHVTGVHGREIESFVFPTNNEFMTWKMQMEHQTKTKFSLLSKYQSKQTYRCTHLSSNEDDKISATFCPSTLIVQDFSKRIYVNFYKEHHSHKANPYTIGQSYKKYCITSILKQADDYKYLNDLGYDENDLYIQFKQLMEGIVLESAKLNVNSLCVLVNSALEMTNVLGSYKADEDISLSKELIRDNKLIEMQLNKAKENLKTYQGAKRISNEVTPVPTKKSKEASSESLSPKKLSIENEPTKAKLNDKDVIKLLKELESEDNENSVANKIASTKVETKVNQSPSSFNDSYKDFVDKNFLSKPEEKKKRHPREVSKVKTKLGQFRPTSKSLTPTSDRIGDKLNVKQKQMERVNIKVTSKLKDKKNPELNELNSKLSGKRLGHKLAVIKNDVDYEVRQQENDCNILVLKI